MKKILLATGIFPPEIGGPALYSKKLAEEFSSMGIEISLLTYRKRFSKSEKYQIFGVSRMWPYGIRQFVYFLKLLKRARNSDAIFAFDSLGAGLPAVWGGKFLKKKVVIRLGGDFLWEKYVESGEGVVTLEEFYQKNLHKNYSLLFKLIRYTLQNADIVAFTTEFQRDAFVAHYSLDLSKVMVIGNVFTKEAGEIPGYQEPKVILWAGRFIKLKNLELLVKVFKQLLDYDKNLILKLVGDGPEKKNIQSLITPGWAGNYQLQNNTVIEKRMDEKSLAEEIKKSYFCALPSLSEVSPNFALQCLALNKPIVLTQETGIKKDFPGLLYADPRKEDSFFHAALRLLDRNSYDNYQKFISNIRHQKTWRDLAEEYLQILQ